MADQKTEKGLQTHTIALMIGVALFFDFLQWLLAFIFMDWLVSVYAFLTFFVWFYFHGIKFMRLKRAVAMGGATLIELIPWVAALPAWTGAVAYIALDAKMKEAISTLPGGNTIGTALVNKSITKQATQIKQPEPIKSINGAANQPTSSRTASSQPKRLEEWGKSAQRTKEGSDLNKAA